MKRTTLLLLIGFLWIAGCGKIDKTEQQITESAIPEVNIELDDDISPVITESVETEEDLPTPPPAVAVETDGSLHFNLSSTSSVRIRSTPDSDGVVVTDTVFIKDITRRMSTFIPHSETDNYVPEYDYILTFYDAAGSELITIQVYENFVISCLGELYYDNTEQLYITKIRQTYLVEVKKTCSIDTTSFIVNGKGFNLQEEIDPSINAITQYTWCGDEEYPEPTLILECHINPNVGYCAVFDVEKMKFVFGNYGTSFTYHNYSASSLVYAFQDSVYNYWGDILYQNHNSDYSIYSLEYSPSTDGVIVTLSHKQDEKLIQVTCLNYHKTYSYFIEYSIENGITPLKLSEFSADLTHDGIDEKLILSKTDAGGDYAYLQIADTAGNTLWSEEAHTSHAGWNSVFLCSRDDKDYILIFNPYQCTGYATFMYVLYYITGPNTIHIVDSGNYSFSDTAEEGTQGAFIEETFRPFADKVYSYLQDSFVLMSTEAGTLIYSTAENHLSVADQYETEKWISEIKNNLCSLLRPD